MKKVLLAIGFSVLCSVATFAGEIFEKISAKEFFSILKEEGYMPNEPDEDGGISLCSADMLKKPT